MIFTQTGVLAASPAFDQAVQEYKSRQYAQALSGFQTALKTNPSDPMTHYYMALCYQGMAQMGQARQQYEIVAGGSNMQLRSYAASGLAQLGKYQTSVGSSARGNPAIKGTAPAASGPKISGRLQVIEFYADW